MAIPPVKVQVDAADSCKHWFCCFGCKCCNKDEPNIRPMSPPSSTDSDSVTITTTSEKTVKVYHKHARKGQIN